MQRVTVLAAVLAVVFGAPTNHLVKSLVYPGDRAAAATIIPRSSYCKCAQEICLTVGVHPTSLGTRLGTTKDLCINKLT
jgi:hypothetical protein